LKWADSRHSYLNKTIVPLILEVCSNPANYEVDPEKVDKGDVKANGSSLLAMTQRFLDKILGSQVYFPV
jgi:hypothetical protein